MKTVITSRKTPHSVVNTLYGLGVDQVYAWCFENGNPEDKLVKKLIPKSHCYVAENTQDIPDYAFRPEDLRKYHVDVWNQKCKNHKKSGKFLTDYELNEFYQKKCEEVVAADNFLKFFV